MMSKMGVKMAKLVKKLVKMAKMGTKTKFLYMEDECLLIVEVKK